jgi:NAD(P)H-flavin reductase/ferredoxin
MTPKVCKVSVNGQGFSAKFGDLLLDAALMNGVDIPHDCRSGHCGTCRVNVVDGRVFGGDGDPDSVKACQCRILSDLEIAIEDVPEAVTISGRVVGLVALAPDVVEVCIKLPRPAGYLSGQHYNVRFRGFPARCYSPTAPLDKHSDDGLVRFHVRLVPNGLVSSALGREIGIGHRVTLLGPHGTAYFRPDHPHRLVLVAGGTGFAPMWSIAHAALIEWPQRELIFVVGARTLNSLYMVPALCQLARYRNVTVVPVVSEPQAISKVVRAGQPTDYLPTFSPSDVVYTAGAPGMVESVASRARAAGAKCYADPFEHVSNQATTVGLWSRAIHWLNSKPKIPSPSIVYEPELTSVRR